MNIKKIVVICILMFVSFAMKTEGISASEWTKSFSQDGMNGMISSDGKRCWIQNMTESSIKNDTLKIPSKVNGAKVVRIGRQYDEEDDSSNILNNSWDWCNGELSESARRLTKVVIPDTVEQIEDYCFMMLSGIETIQLPKQLKTIRSSAFYGCYGLKKLQLPSSVEVIGDNAFSGCRRLETISIGKKVRSISKSAFVGCISLNKVTIHKKNKQYQVKGGCIYEKEKNALFMIFAQQETFSVPKGIKVIPENCLQSGKIKTIVIPASVKEIQNDAFAVNRKLKIIVNKKNKTFRNLGEHVIKKKDGLLVCMNVYGKKTVKLPKGVKIVQESMSIIGDGHGIEVLVFPSTLKSVRLTPNSYTKFYSYFGLREMHFMGKKPPVFTAYGFGCDGTIYVPKGSKEAYRKAMKDKNKIMEV